MDPIAEMCALEELVALLQQRNMDEVRLMSSSLRAALDAADGFDQLRAEAEADRHERIVRAHESMIAAAVDRITEIRDAAPWS